MAGYHRFFRRFIRFWKSGLQYSGTYGASNPCRLTFDFSPQVLILTPTINFTLREIHETGYVCVKGVNNAVEWGHYYLMGDYFNRYTIYVTFNGNTVKWFNYFGSEYQMNSDGFVYGYVAIG